MVADGGDLLRVAPWISFAPGLAIGIAVLGFNLVGDGLREAYDPRFRSEDESATQVVPEYDVAGLRRRGRVSRTAEYGTLEPRECRSSPGAHPGCAGDI